MTVLLPAAATPREPVDALSLIVEAYESCNRLSPGETLGADDAAFGLRRLNLLVDKMSAQRRFLFRDVLTSVAQTGHIALGAGLWAGVDQGDEIVSASADDCPMSPITMRQYNESSSLAETGSPVVYAPDGMGTVYLYPVPTGQTIRMQTRKGASTFADQTTLYTLPAGYRAALVAGLAVSIAPVLLGSVPAALVLEASQAMAAIETHAPSIVDVHSFTRPARHAGAIFRGE